MSCQKQSINVEEPEYSVSGKVIYPDGTPYNGLYVYIKNQTTTHLEQTDAFGCYQFSGLESGKYQIFVPDLAIVRANIHRVEYNIEIGQSNKTFNIYIGKNVVHCKDFMSGSIDGYNKYFVALKYDDLFIGNNSYLVTNCKVYLNSPGTTNYGSLEIYEIPLGTQFHVSPLKNIINNGTPIGIAEKSGLDLFEFDIDLLIDSPGGLIFYNYTGSRYNKLSGDAFAGNLYINYNFN